LDKAKILAVVDMPPETFQPSTSTKTSLLFLQKKKENIENYSIFMAVAEKCGHDRRGKQIKEDDFPTVSETYRQFLKENKINF